MGTPTPKSYEQILGDMISTYMGKFGIDDLNTGAANISFFEAVAQAVYRASADTFSILRDFNVDRASGEKLKRIAKEENVRVRGDRVATGTVTIRDSSFEKIVTKVYAGANPPNRGSSVIKVSDASLFPATGSIYIGRGTPNVEGPLSYNAITPIGGYFEISLVSPTSKFHNISESVILAQGGVRSIPSGEVVISPTSGASADVSFTLTQQAIILDGENVITGVAVAATQPGTDGNIPRGGIKRFAGVPFTGATVTNDAGFTTGKNADTDEQIRNNIKKSRISRGLGTAIAVKNSVLGAQAPDENATVTSNEIFSDGVTTTLFIDNGEGYESKTTGVGLEFIVDSALGGETSFNLATGGRQTSVEKAFLFSNEVSPYNIVGNDRLSLLVGGNLSEHVFQSSDFRSEGNATAFEVVASINANPSITFSATTVNNGTGVRVFARSEENEFIEKTTPTTGGDVGEALGLPIGEAQTLRLYKNKKPLNKNGRVAQLVSEEQVNWSNTITAGDTLIVSVDKTGEITYTFTDADFLSEGTHPTVNKNNSLASWVNVINAKVTGVTASINGNRLVLTSNLGAILRASLDINSSSSLVSKGMFTVSGGLSVVGKAADFTLSRNTAQFKLKEPLEKGDSLSSGTEFTKGRIETNPILGGSVTLLSDAYLWFMVDNQSAEKVNTGVTADTTITVSKPSANIVRYLSNNATAFTNVQVGDWVIIWSTELAAGNRLEARVYEVGANYIDFKVTPTEYASATVEGPIVWGEGIDVLRTEQAVQKVKVDAGSYNINTIAALLMDSIIGVNVSAENDELIILTTKSEDQYGEVFIVAFNDAAKGLNFTVGSRGKSESSLFAFYENENADGDFPLFVNSKITDDSPADPPNSLITDFDSVADLALLGIDPNALVCMLEPFSAIQDNVSAKECTQIDDLVGNTIDIQESQLLRRLRQNDRFYVADTYQFSAEDTIVAILDGDPSNKTFPIPLYRRAIANNSIGIDTNNWRAFDVESGASTEFEEFFGSDFSFKNYRALMKAKNVIDPSTPTAAQDALLFRSSEWGRAGERVNVGYVYPTAPNQAITHSVFVNVDTMIRIGLKSGNAIANTIDGTTEWNVTVTNMGLYDEVTYTHNGTGTNPNIDSALSSGGYVTINDNGEFAAGNIGTFRVSSATSTSFTTIRAAGDATAETNKATLTNTTIVLFEKDLTTAADINTYVNASMSDYLTSEIVNDAGLAGTGVISKSTEEDANFAYSGVDLLDGINWVEVSNLSAISPNYQFRFKEALSLPSYDTSTLNAYAFNAGEEVRLIPTTAKQVVEFMNTLAVTGFTTLGDITTSSRERKIQFRTEILGSNGVIQVTGGRGNSASAQILQAASRIENSNLMKGTVLKSSASGFHVDQWVKFEATQAQKKDVGMGFATTVTIVPNSPIAGQSTISLANRAAHNHYFGQARNFFRDEARTFHVEKHGKLVCIAWDEVGSDPIFSKTVEINDVVSTISVDKNDDTGYTEYTVDSGNINFLESQRGDSFTVAGLADSVNNGTFPVVGVSDNGKTIVVDNSKGIDATGVSLPLASISITAEIKEGDSVVLGAPFATLNRGTFRVIRKFNKSFYIENPNAVEEIVTVSSNLRSLGFDGTTAFDVVVSSGVMRLEWDTNGTEPSLGNAKFGDIVTIGTDFASGNQGSFLVLKSGDNYIECANAKATAETGVLVTDVLQAHQPSIKFAEYDVTSIGDSFIVSGDVFDGDNIGTYQVIDILNRETIVVGSILAAKSGIQLENKFTQVYIQEGLKYYGYKQIFNKAVDPSNINRTSLVFTTNNQYLKINRDAGEVLISAVGKLGFNTSVKRGLDSYKYNIGLIAESNRIVYGDPRDNVTYPGVSAAGAEIFIQPPLIRRIEVGVGIRVNTGIPFGKIIEQVRNNIAALINSSPIGQSIAISDIVAVVNSIPGVKAVSITSPSYDVSNDIITVNPSEKPFILDIVNDITVSKVE